MSSGYMYGDEIGSQPVSRPAVTSGGDKKLKILLAVIGVILVAELIWLFGIAPSMPLSKITVSGIPGIDDTTVLALAGIGNQSSFITINAQAAEQALLGLPAVRSARVVKRFPNRVEVYLESRRAAAVAFVSVGERIFPALIDGDGMVFSVGTEGFREKENLPVISGLMLEGVYSGMKLPRMYNSLFARLEHLTSDAPELLAAISEIKINHKNYDGYDLTLYPALKGTRVRVSDVNEETLRYMLLMLDVLSAKQMSIEEIDFRTGTASYKEAHSG